MPSTRPRSRASEANGGGARGGAGLRLEATSRKRIWLRPRNFASFRPSSGPGAPLPSTSSWADRRQTEIQRTNEESHTLGLVVLCSTPSVRRPSRPLLKPMQVQRAQSAGADGACVPLEMCAQQRAARVAAAHRKLAVRPTGTRRACLPASCQIGFTRLSLLQPLPFPLQLLMLLFDRVDAALSRPGRPLRLVDLNISRASDAENHFLKISRCRCQIVPGTSPLC